MVNAHDISRHTYHQKSLEFTPSMLIEDGHRKRVKMRMFIKVESSIEKRAQGHLQGS